MDELVKLFQQQQQQQKSTEQFLQFVKETESAYSNKFLTLKQKNDISSNEYNTKLQSFIQRIQQFRTDCSETFPRELLRYKEELKAILDSTDCFKACFDKCKSIAVLNSIKEIMEFYLFILSNQKKLSINEFIDMATLYSKLKISTQNSYLKLGLVLKNIYKKIYDSIEEELIFEFKKNLQRLNLSDYKLDELRKYLFRNICTYLDGKSEISDLKNLDLYLLAKSMSDLFLLENFSPSKDDNSVSCLIKELLEPLSIKFKFHFYGDKKTNRVDKPEWFFAFISEAIQSYKSFFTFGQVILDFTCTKYSLVPFRDFSEEFILGCIVLLVLNKIKQQAEYLINDITNFHKSTLSYSNLIHLANECISFDLLLTKSFGFNHVKTFNRWKTYCLVSSDHSIESDTNFESDGCCLSVFTLNKHMLSFLIDVNSKVFMSKFQLILESPKAWDLFYTDLNDDDTFKASNVSVRLIDLLENITEHYKNYRKLSHKVQFLQQIQYPILYRFIETVNFYIQEYKRHLEYHHFRLLPSWSKVEYLFRIPHDLGENPRLVSVLGRYLSSVYYVSLILTKWGESVFFLQLQEFNEGISSSVDNCFESTIVRLDQTMDLLQDLIVQTVMLEIRTLIRDYEQEIYGIFIKHEVTNEQDNPELTRSMITFLIETNNCIQVIYEQLPFKRKPILFQKILMKLFEEIDQRLFEAYCIIIEYDRVLIELIVYDTEQGLVGSFGEPWCKRSNLESSSLIFPRVRGLNKILKMTEGELSEDIFNSMMIRGFNFAKAKKVHQSIVGDIL